MAIPLYAALNELPVYFLLHVMSVTTVVRNAGKGRTHASTYMQPATYDSITKAIDDLHQRMCGTGQPWWSVLWEKTDADTTWLTVIPQHREVGTKMNDGTIILSGTPAEIYHHLRTHLHMLTEMKP